MISLPKAQPPPKSSSWRWSIRAMLWMTAIVAVCVWALSIHYGLGIFACLVAGPAMLLCGLNRFRNPHGEGLKLWTFICLLFAGATGPPLLSIWISPRWDVESLLFLLQASCAGVILAAIYGFYLVLMASIFEAAFGVGNGELNDESQKNC
jgi:hypothetical protein